MKQHFYQQETQLAQLEEDQGADNDKKKRGKGRDKRRKKRK